MSFLRSTFRVAPRTAFRTTLPARATFTTTPRTLAGSDYGSGAGDPKGENPQDQGANPSADKEHPGPPPPAAGKGSGSTPTKGGDGKAHQGESPNSGEGKKGTSRGQEKSGSDGKAAQPKILNESPPKDSEAPQEVKQHNAELDQRVEKQYESVTDVQAEKDKVSKKFWAGTGGAEKDS